MLIPFKINSPQKLTRMFTLKNEEDDLDATDDGESGEEPHGASNETQLGLSLDHLVPF